MKNEDLHGNAPDRAEAAVIVLDMINDLEFPEGEAVREAALPAAGRISALAERARAAGVPVIFANDNFGRWRSDLGDVLDHVLHDGVRGRPLAERLRPAPDDYVVLKPKHSAFFSTPLDTLLRHLGTSRLVLTGLTADMCVLFTAMDAHLRDLHLHVPEDCVASISPRRTRDALRYLRDVLGADVRPSEELDLEALGRGGSGG
jgi:nicotinamidase-related amidase